MSDPFIGEIRIFAGNFAPLDWALCNGAVMAISQNETLFQLIGTTYGGDGQQTFAVPDLRGRVPIHTGPNGTSNYVLGQSGGQESVTLTNSQLPAHNHLLPASSASGTSTSPAGNVPAAWGSNQYSDAPPTGAMGAAVQPAGASLPHDNMLPFLGINFIISLFGTFPTQS